MKRALPLLLLLAIVVLAAVWSLRSSQERAANDERAEAAQASAAGGRASDLLPARPARAPGAPTDAGALAANEPAQGELEPLDCKAPKGNIATIDGEGITAADFCADWQRLSGSVEAGDPAVMDKQGKTLLDRMIDARLIARALQAAGKPVTTAEVDAAFDALWRKQSSSRRAFEQTLRDQGVDVNVVRRDLEHRLARERLVELRGSNEPTDAEIAAAYNADPTRFGKPQTATLETFIARAAPSAPAHERARALTAAQAFAAAVTSGADAKTSAEKHGLTATPAVQLTRQDPEPELATVAFGLKPGQWSPPVQTRAGWVVGKLVQIDEGKARPLDQVRNQVRELVKSDRKLREEEDVVRDLRAQAKIVQLQW